MLEKKLKRSWPVCTDAKVFKLNRSKGHAFFIGCEDSRVQKKGLKLCKIDTTADAALAPSLYQYGLLKVSEQKMSQGMTKSIAQAIKAEITFT